MIIPNIKSGNGAISNSIAAFCVCSKTVKYIYMGTCFFTGKMIKLLRGLIKKHSKNCCLRWGSPGKFSVQFSTPKRVPIWFYAVARTKKNERFQR